MKAGFNLLFVCALAFGVTSSNAKSQPASSMPTTSLAPPSRKGILLGFVCDAVDVCAQLREVISNERIANVVTRTRTSVLRLGDEVIPNDLTDEFVDGARIWCQRPLEIRYDDPTYCDLLILRRLWEIKLLLEHEKLLGAPSDDRRRAMNVCVQIYVAGVRQSMRARLGGIKGLILDSDIDACIDTLSEQLVTRSGQLELSALKLPLSVADTNALIVQFDERLSASLPRARVLLNGTNAATSKEAHAVACARVLDEIRGPAEVALERKTVDHARDVPLPNEIVASYIAVCDHLADRERVLSTTSLSGQ